MSDQPLTDEQLAGWVEHSDPFPPYWEAEHDTYLDAMAAELLELRRTLNSVVLEAAQRPPLGYVTVDLQSENPPSLIEADREIASQQLADDRAASPLGDWVLLEVREVAADV